MASAACTAAAGIGVSLTFIFKSCDNGSSTLPESSSVSIEENSSVDSVTETVLTLLIKRMLIFTSRTIIPNLQAKMI